MARDFDKYYYVEVSLPKGDDAIEFMVSEAERLHIPLPIFIRQACITLYSGDVAAHPSTRKASTRKKTTPRTKKVASNAVPDSAVDSANAFLDDDGF